LNNDASKNSVGRFRVNDVHKLNRAQNYPVDRVVDLLGIVVNKQGLFVCPFHQDPNPTMGVIKAKNKCRCSECGREASSVELVMTVMGYDAERAMDFFLNPGEKPAPVKRESDNRTGASPGPVVQLSPGEQLLGRFYREICRPLPRRVRERFVKGGFSAACLARDRVGWLPKIDESALEPWVQGVDRDALGQSGLFVGEPGGRVRPAFEGERVVFPCFDFRSTAETGAKRKAVFRLKAAKIDCRRWNETEAFETGRWWPYGMDRVNWNRKILLCEGELNVLAVSSFSSLYCPVGLVNDDIPDDILEAFRGADVTVALFHPRAGKNQFQRALTGNYNARILKLSALFESRLNLKLKVLKTPIGDTLFQHFKRLRRRI
jgi:hypothetical protein